MIVYGLRVRCPSHLLTSFLVLRLSKSGLVRTIHGASLHSWNERCSLPRPGLFQVTGFSIFAVVSDYAGESLASETRNHRLKFTNRSILTHWLSSPASR